MSLKKMFSIVSFFVLLLVLCSMVACPHAVVEQRVAFDIGAGQVKMQVADVNTTLNKIVNVLLTDNVFVPLREDLAKSLDGRFSVEIESSLVNSITGLMKKAETFHPQAFHAVATEPFRLAKNGFAVINRIKKETGLDVTIISQTEEGILGLTSALHESDVEPEHVVSWDFGGGSFQITTKCGIDFCVYQGRFGKIPFRDALLQIQGKNVQETSTPNPISKGDLDQALEFIQDNVTAIPEEIIKKISHPNIVVLGIGSNPLWGMENNATYDTARVMNEMTQRLGLDDEAIVAKDSIEVARKDSASFVVSNLILAYGVMKTFGIREVKYVGTPGANAIGLLLSPNYWNRPMSSKKYVFKPYNQIFPALFEKEKERIEQNIDVSMVIEHIGSTAVPGLGGKGIIDIGIAVNSADVELVSRQLQALGYELKPGLPHLSAPNRHFLVADLPDPEESFRRYHIHLMEPINPEWKRFLVFRGYLRDHPEASQEYAAVKQLAVSEAKGSGEKYRELKESIFKKLID